MARLGIFAATGDFGETRGSWYWGMIESGRSLTIEEFRRPGKGGVGGAWFTPHIDRARAFGTEIAAQAAVVRLCEEHGYSPESIQIRPLPERRRGALVEGGVLRIPLYHGTSDLFLESIRTFGLGGADPLAPLRVLDFLRDLVDWCDLRSEADPEFGAFWSGRRLELEPTKLRGTRVLDFQHGRTWITPSRRSAVRHALLNLYGSEALSEALRLYQDVTLQVPGQLDQLPFASSPVLGILDRKPSPILLQADGVALDYLGGEAGLSAAEVARHLDEIWDPANPELFDDLTQRDSFEVGKPIPVDRLRLSRVVRSGDDLSLPEFELEPLP